MEVAILLPRCSPLLSVSHGPHLFLLAWDLLVAPDMLTTAPSLSPIFLYELGPRTYGGSINSSIFAATTIPSEVPSRPELPTRQQLGSPGTETQVT